MIVMDLETTGLLMPEASHIDEQPYIIEFGAIKLDKDLKKVKELEFMVNPGIPLTPLITKITKITDDDLKDKPPFISYFDKLAEFFLGEDTMVAHNLPFDKGILKYNLDRIDKTTNFPWPIKHLCTVEIGQQVWRKKRKLSDIYKEVIGKEHKGAHRALVDVEATVEVLRWYRENGHLDD
jgi:DNA polymerase-3 subunit alpha (Gram-positive type)